MSLFRLFTCVMLCAALTAPAGEAAAAPKRHKAAGGAGSGAKSVPLPRPKPTALAASGSRAASAETVPAPRPHPGASKRPVMAAIIPMTPGLDPDAEEKPRRPHPIPEEEPPPARPPAGRISASDLAAVKQAFALIRKGKGGEASELKKSVSDPVAAKLIEWNLLRSPDIAASFERYAAFVRANPSWPSIGMLRRRAEGALWDDRRDAATVRSFFAGSAPTSGKGRLALARALLMQGDRANAARYLREAWHEDAFSAEVEAQAIETFGDLLTAADHKARMDQRLYDEDVAGAMRMANRLGGTALAIAKARAAVINGAANAGALLDAVPAEGRSDPGYIFSRIQWLRRKDRIGEAVELMLAAPTDRSVLRDVDEWWVERRLIARKLLDHGEPRLAYRVVRDAAPPVKEDFRVDHEFTAGWIALRFLHDPRTALAHFARIPESTAHPTSLARAYYWQGRALEQMGRHHDARAHYQVAARYSAAYYGQIARAKLGVGEMSLRRPPAPTGAERAALQNHDVVRAIEILYALGERDLVVTMVADLPDRPVDVGVLVLVGEIAARERDARAMLYLGKRALARGYPLEHFAFPDVGVPHVTDLGPKVDRSIVYAIARQESAFNPRAVSSAKAMGLMQVTPATGRHIARRHGVKFDKKRLLHDPAYNTQLGTAELASLLQDYRGSYILAFAAYNAGRGRVREWIARYGDPRDPRVDPIDWVERIPFTETRNYVQRIMENMQVYRLRLNGSSRLTIEADLHRGAEVN